MTKRVKIWLICAAVLILIGTIIFAGIMAVINWDFTKLSTVKYHSNEHNVYEAFQNIDISTDTAHIRFVPSNNDNTSIVCREKKNINHSVEVANGTLSIKCNDTRKWYEYVEIMSFGTPEITVYLPETEYKSLTVKGSTGDVEIPPFLSFDSIDVKISTGDIESCASAETIRLKASTGDISVESVTAKSLDVSASTGDVEIENVKAENIGIYVTTGDTDIDNVICNNISSDGTTGDITLNNTVVSEQLKVKRNTGDVQLNRCDADEITIKTTTGHVHGSLLSGKEFITSTDTGSVSVPQSTSDGKCHITTDTGNIKITVKALH